LFTRHKFTRHKYNNNKYCLHRDPNLGPKILLLNSRNLVNSGHLTILLLFFLILLLCSLSLLPGQCQQMLTIDALETDDVGHQVRSGDPLSLCDHGGDGGGARGERASQEGHQRGP
jgi:hypothetical protein